MKIGIVSDTHGNMEILENVATWMARRQKVTTLYHLGDDFDDTAKLGDLFSEVVQVPGIYDERYKNGSLPAKQFEMVLGISLLLVHSFEKDVKKEDILRSDILVYGHTHKEELRLSDGRLFMNPGHLKGPLDKNMPPTFGMLTIMDRNITAAIYGTNFKPVRVMEIVRSESGLYKTAG